jgi:hypothetical protein
MNAQHFTLQLEPTGRVVQLSTSRMSDPEVGSQSLDRCDSWCVGKHTTKPVLTSLTQSGPKFTGQANHQRVFKAPSIKAEGQLRTVGLQTEGLKGKVLPTKIKRKK